MRPNQYNGNDLQVGYPYEKFFIIMSIGEADVHTSVMEMIFK